MARAPAMARLIVAAAALLLAAPTVAAEPPRVVASIKPLQGLAAAVMVGIAEPKLLVEGAASPHAYTLKPSAARALGAADLILWIGGGYETFLQKPLASLAQSDAVITAAELPGIALLPLRLGADWADQEHAGEEPSGSASYDGHLWLSPDNAAVIVSALAEALAARDPERAARYRANAKAALAQIAKLDAELAASLEPLQGRRFLVFHDAYQYLERRYGLTPVGAVAVHPEQPPGARHVAELSRRVREGEVRCLFSEPQFAPDLLRTIAAGTRVRLGVLDPLGAGLPAGPAHYPTLMRGLARSLGSCLGGPG